jgi:hypothetical protein
MPNPQPILGGRGRYRTLHRDVSLQGNRGAGDGSVQPVIAGKPKHTIYIQEIWMNVYTDAAQSATWRPNTTTARTILFVPASPGIGPQRIEFDDEGYALPEGEGLELILSAAGLAFDYKVVAYLKPTSTMTTAEAVA